MAISPPDGELWTKVLGHSPELWPEDDEEVASLLAGTLDRVSGSMSATAGETDAASGVAKGSWRDDVGAEFTDLLRTNGTQMTTLAADVGKRAHAVLTYAGVLTDTKNQIRTTVDANQPIYSDLGRLPIPFNLLFQDQFARAVAGELDKAVQQGVEKISQIPLPAVPSHEDLLARYQVPDDPDGKHPFLPMTAREAAFALSLPPWELAQAYEIKTAAEAAADGSFPGEGRAGNQDNHRDAVRHATWNALMAAQLGQDKANALGTLHEGAPDPTPRDHLREAMDLHNNEVGRQIAANNPDANREELTALVQQAARDGKLVVISADERLVSSDYDFRR